jgi:flagellar biosynthesis protein FlhF
MIQETFVANTPKLAYEEAVKKYKTKDLEIVSARQIKYNDTECSELILNIPKEIFMKHSFLSDIDVDSDDELYAQIEELKGEIESFKQELIGSNSTIQIESDSKADKILKDVKELFLSKGLSHHWLDTIIDNLKQSVIVDDKSLLVSYIVEEIDDGINIKEEDLSSKKVVMLVGPTGVGKTTTLAKLAARYAYLLDRPYKVALLNLDSYKVGATEQLSHYADIMQLEHIVVANVDEFSTKISSLEDSYDLILVDTAGMSPYDTEKFLKTIEYISANMEYIDVNLVIPATLKYEDMVDIYDNFSFLNPSSIVITKFDETKHFGALLSFMLVYGLPMSYFCVGQEVPDDLVVANKEYLLERFIGDMSDA